MKNWKWLGLAMVLVFVLSEAALAYYGYGKCPVKMGSGKIWMLLLAMVGGYWVLTLSDKQNKPLDKLGRLVGGFILVVSFVGVICGIVCHIMTYST